MTLQQVLKISDELESIESPEDSDAWINRHAWDLIEEIYRLRKIMKDLEKILNREVGADL